MKELQSYLSVPGAQEYYGAMVEDARNNPDTLPTPEFIEMTREEQMKWHWERHNKMMKINPDRYFKKIESGLTMPHYLSPAIDPTTLHYGMFQTAVMKLGSDEQNALWLDDIRNMRMMGCYA